MKPPLVSVEAAVVLGFIGRRRRSLRSLRSLWSLQTQQHNKIQLLLLLRILLNFNQSFVLAADALQLIQTLPAPLKIIFAMTLLHSKFFCILAISWCFNQS